MARTRPAEAPEEWESKWVVAQVLNGAPSRRDPPGPDYDIKVGSRSIALEITKSAPAERNALNAAIHRLHQREQELLSRHWQVAIPDARLGFRGPSLQAIFDNAPALLHALEGYGVEAFGAAHENEHPPYDAQEPIRKLLELGLLWGQSLPLFSPIERPQLLVGTRSRGGFLDPNDVNTCVETCAARKARQLLAATEVDERHLFVVVESTDYGAFAALTVGWSLPGHPPNLPQGINTVWVGAWRPGSWGGCDFFPIWRARPPLAWERVIIGDPQGYAAAHGEPGRRRADDEAREAVRLELNKLADETRLRIGRSWWG